jgi:hypothetical protein
MRVNVWYPQSGKRPGEKRAGLNTNHPQAAATHARTDSDVFLVTYSAF